jgi:hypothetical protein
MCGKCEERTGFAQLDLGVMWLLGARPAVIAQLNLVQDEILRT